MRSLCPAFVFLTALGVHSARSADAAPLIPGPDHQAHDGELAEKADKFQLQLHQFHTLQVGFALDAKISDPVSVDLVNRFFESGERDFEAFSGRHPYEIVEDYGDYLHASIFGGTQIAGDAFRYAVLRDRGAPQAMVEEARQIYLDHLDALDWMVRITGEPGVVARGIRRVMSEDGDLTMPGEMPELVPLFDDDGDPLPKHKEPTWRADRSKELPFLIWIDDASRDTFVGYVYALGVAYDVGVGDSTIPEEKLDRLANHARDIGMLLLEKVDVGGDDDIDMVIHDADGRPTTYHALSAEEIWEGLVSVEAASGFNAVVGLGILRTLFHVSGEPRLWVRYREMVGERGFVDVMNSTLSDMLYFREITNYSVVNMAFLGAYGLLRYESDPALAERYREILRTQMYDVGVDRDARGLGLSLFDLIFAAFGPTGVEGVGEEALDDAMITLRGHRSVPYWEEWIENCDVAEIAALDCELIDGSRVQLSARRGYGGERVVAVEPLPIAARPPSDFMWRADPHGVNGGGRPRLNAGADFHGAYWMGRFLEAASTGMTNVSPNARGEPDLTGLEGCQCSGEHSTDRANVWLIVFALVAMLRRRS